MNTDSLDHDNIVHVVDIDDIHVLWDCGCGVQNSLLVEISFCLHPYLSKNKGIKK